MSDRLLQAILDRMSPENREEFVAEIRRQEERLAELEPFLAQIREAPTRAQAAAVLVQLRRVAFVVQWSAVNDAIQSRWSARAVRWAHIRAAKLDRAQRGDTAGYYVPHGGRR